MSEKKTEIKCVESGKPKYYLMCERLWVYHVLIVVAGFYGSYTYLLKGDVFCNAQTGNVVLMGMALGRGRWIEGLYYIIPITAYIMGTFISELLPNPLKKVVPIRWDSLLIGIEIIVVFILGFVPDTAPVQISQVAINFIASMQYNTFRQAEGVPMATTFATNHVRQIGIGLAREIKHRNSEDKSYRVKLYRHFGMLIYFAIGAIVGAFFSNFMLGKAIWITIIPLTVIFLALVYADLTKERDLIYRKPLGH